jgi:2,4'-dihydroxyacetophenone dioxygenase
VHCPSEQSTPSKKVQAIQAILVDAESVPWIPFAPYSELVHVKYYRLDPVRGETIAMFKAPAGVLLPRHRHPGIAITYTLEGRWKYREHDWIAGPGSVVFDHAASCHTPEVVEPQGEIQVLSVASGDVTLLGDDGQVLGVENWMSALERYHAYCRRQRILPRKLTSVG